MNELTVEEAEKSFSRILWEMVAGEEIIITHDQKPIAKLVSLAHLKLKKRIKAGSAKGLIKSAEDFDEPLEDFKEYMS